MNSCDSLKKIKNTSMMRVKLSKGQNNEKRPKRKLQLNHSSELLSLCESIDLKSAEVTQEDLKLEFVCTMESGIDSCIVIRNDGFVNELWFNDYYHMRKVLCKALSYTLLISQVREIGYIFQSYFLDESGRGEIKLLDLKNLLVDRAENGSLGVMTERDINLIFNGLKCSSLERHVSWIDFFADLMRRCESDERKIQQLFHKMDSDHKGFIALNTLHNFIESIYEEWNQTLQVVSRNRWEIFERQLELPRSEGYLDCDDFMLFMKGQVNVKKSNLGIGICHFKMRNSLLKSCREFEKKSEVVLQNTDQILSKDSMKKLCEWRWKLVIRSVAIQKYVSICIKIK